MDITLKSTFDKKEVDKLCSQIKQREGEISMLRTAIKHYMNLCRHPGMRSYKEIDGSSGCHCSICGYSN